MRPVAVTPRDGPKNSLPVELAPAISEGQRFTLTAEVRFPHPIRVYVLEGRGAVAPLAFCNSTTLLLDRMIVSHARKLLRQPDHPELQAEKWWLEQINSAAIRFNVVLAAIEGSAGRFPSLEDFRDEAEAATSAVAAVLTEAVPVRYDAAQLEAVYRMFSEKQKRYRKELAFLVAAVPLLCQRLPPHQLLDAEQRILSIADHEDLSTATLSVLIALSCLYESNEQRSPARGVIKPKTIYAEPEAHNTLADLHSLEFLISTQGLPFASARGICTCDEALMRLWNELAPNAGAQSDETFKFNAQLTRNLFARLTEAEHAQLVERLRERALRFAAARCR